MPLPGNKPSTRPGGGTGNRPGTTPGNRPGGGAGNPGIGNGNRPGTLPGTGNRPGTGKPGIGNGNRPGTGNPGIGNGNRPGTGNPGIGNGNRPGNRPGIGDGNRPGDRPGIGNGNRPGNRPGIGNGNRPGNKPVVRPGQNTRPIKRPDFNRPGNGRPGSGNNNWWNSGNNINIGSGNTNININNNFKKNLNWSTNRKNWGSNPWWNRPANRPWYGGSWNCGWNNRYYNHHRHYHRYYGGYRPLPGYVVYDSGPSAGEVIGWGLAAWGLGKLIFDSGYNSYSNPYPTQPVPTSTGAPVTYSQPITVVAASAPEQDEQQIVSANEKSETYILDSQSSFKQGNYLAALEAANKAIAVSPGDGALHEYRALVLFALGKFGEAAGVLNPVLASGPGWDWTTMVKLYDSQETYTKQLQKLEEYTESKPDDAAAHFLLGYHYMVCGHLDMATAQFQEAAKLQPSDNVSAQLADLCSASSTSADGDAVPEGSDKSEAPADPADDPPPAPVPLDKLSGTWVSDKGKEGTITLALKDDGKFIWTFDKDGKSNAFDGEYSMNDSGLLVLDTSDTQMVASVELPEDSEMKFILAGGPPQDPGLDFKKKS